MQYLTATLTRAYRCYSRYRLAQLPLLALILLSLAACATTPAPVVSALPAVSDDVAATITLRSKDNFGDTKYQHLLMIDGIVAGKFQHENVQSFRVAAGVNRLQLTCHSLSKFRRDDGNTFNLSVVDGKTSKEVDVQAGDEVCLKISFNPLNCAVLQEAAPSYCE